MRRGNVPEYQSCGQKPTVEISLQLLAHCFLVFTDLLSGRNFLGIR
jgi:hypothetical protein